MFNCVFIPFKTAPEQLLVLNLMLSYRVSGLLFINNRGASGNFLDSRHDAAWTVLEPFEVTWTVHIAIPLVG